MARKQHENNSEQQKNVNEAVETTPEVTEVQPEPEVVMENTVQSEETVSEAVDESEIVEEAPEKTGGAVENVISAFKEGASDAREAAANFIPSVGKLVHQGVYRGFYAVTYGVVFGSLVVGSLIPTDNAMGEGVRDGIDAAQKAFKSKKAVAETKEAPAEEGLVTA